MATAGGPRLKGLDRGNALTSGASIIDALCYTGDPTTNICYDSAISGYETLSQNYDWNNSGTSSRTNNPAGMPKPVGYGSTTIAVVEKKCLTTGSQHFAMGYNTSVSGGTTYTCSMWYRQSRVGVGGPYIRQKDNNNSLGGMEWVGRDGTQAISGTSNWPANEWLLLKKTVTTTAGETGLYVSNYIGSAVGDTAWAFAPQFEAKSYFTPVVLNSDQTAAGLTRSTSQSLIDLSREENTNTLTNGTVIGKNHFKKGSIIDLCSSSFDGLPCLDFDGLDDYVQVAHNSAFLTSKTWELWVNFDSFPGSSTYDTVFQKSPNWNNADTIGMNLIYGNFRWSFGHHWGGAIFDALSNLSVGVWYHAVGTVDMADPTMTSRTYLNGVAKGTQTNPYTDRPTNSNALNIGTGSGGAFNGQIAVFNVYQEELTAAQVLYNFNSKRSYFDV